MSHVHGESSDVHNCKDNQDNANIAAWCCSIDYQYETQSINDSFLIHAFEQDDVTLDYPTLP